MYGEIVENLASGNEILRVREEQESLELSSLYHDGILIKAMYNEPVSSARENRCYVTSAASSIVTIQNIQRVM
jgi:hypothetical protein